MSFVGGTRGNEPMKIGDVLKKAYEGLSKEEKTHLEGQIQNIGNENLQNIFARLTSADEISKFFKQIAIAKEIKEKTVSPTAQKVDTLVRNLQNADVQTRLAAAKDLLKSISGTERPIIETTREEHLDPVIVKQEEINSLFDKIGVNGENVEDLLTLIDKTVTIPMSKTTSMKTLVPLVDGPTLLALAKAIKSRPEVLHRLTHLVETLSPGEEMTEKKLSIQGKLLVTLHKLLRSVDNSAFDIVDNHLKTQELGALFEKGNVKHPEDLSLNELMQSKVIGGTDQSITDKQFYTILDKKNEIYNALAALADLSQSREIIDELTNNKITVKGFSNAVSYCKEVLGKKMEPDISKAAIHLLVMIQGGDVEKLNEYVKSYFGNQYEFGPDLTQLEIVRGHEQATQALAEVFHRGSLAVPRDPSIVARLLKESTKVSCMLAALERWEKVSYHSKPSDIDFKKYYRSLQTDVTLQEKNLIDTLRDLTNGLSGLKNLLSQPGKTIEISEIVKNTKEQGEIFLKIFSESDENNLYEKISKAIHFQNSKTTILGHMLKLYGTLFQNPREIADKIAALSNTIEILINLDRINKKEIPNLMERFTANDQRNLNFFIHVFFEEVLNLTINLEKQIFQDPTLEFSSGHSLQSLLGKLHDLADQSGLFKFKDTKKPALSMATCRTMQSAISEVERVAESKQSKIPDPDKHAPVLIKEQDPDYILGMYYTITERPDWDKNDTFNLLPRQSPMRSQLYYSNAWNRGGKWAQEAEKKLVATSSVAPLSEEQNRDFLSKEVLKPGEAAEKYHDMIVPLEKEKKGEFGPNMGIQHTIAMNRLKVMLYDENATASTRLQALAHLAAIYEPRIVSGDEHRINWLIPLAKKIIEEMKPDNATLKDYVKTIQNMKTFKSATAMLKAVDPSIIEEARKEIELIRKERPPQKMTLSRKLPAIRIAPKTVFRQFDITWNEYTETFHIQLEKEDEKRVAVSWRDQKVFLTHENPSITFGKNVADENYKIPADPDYTADEHIKISYNSEKNQLSVRNLDTGKPVELTYYQIIA